MVILCDTREQKNEHILSAFEKAGLQYQKKALKTGDYSFMIRACPELGFAYDTYFTDEIVIEKKNSLSELASNFASASDDGERIFKEFNRMINVERAYLVIESDSIDGIFEHKYRSEFNPDSFIRTLITWQARNYMHIYFCKKENTARMIYELCKNCLDAKILK